MQVTPRKRTVFLTDIFIKMLDAGLAFSSDVGGRKKVPMVIDK